MLDGSLRAGGIERHRERLNLRQTTDLQSERGARSKILTFQSILRQQTLVYGVSVHRGRKPNLTSVSKGKSLFFIFTSI